jgi:hypothetical protein
MRRADSDAMKSLLGEVEPSEALANEVEWLRVLGIEDQSQAFIDLSARMVAALDLGARHPQHLELTTKPMRLGGPRAAPVEVRHRVVVNMARNSTACAFSFFPQAGRVEGSLLAPSAGAMPSGASTPSGLCARPSLSESSLAGVLLVDADAPALSVHASAPATSARGSPPETSPIASSTAAGDALPLRDQPPAQHHSAHHYAEARGSADTSPSARTPELAYADGGTWAMEASATVIAPPVAPGPPHGAEPDQYYHEDGASIDAFMANCDSLDLAHLVDSVPLSELLELSHAVSVPSGDRL